MLKEENARQFATVTRDGVGVGSQAGTYQPAHKASFEQTPAGQNNHTRGNNNKKRRTVISDQNENQGK